MAGGHQTNSDMLISAAGVDIEKGGGALLPRLCDPVWLALEHPTFGYAKAVGDDRPPERRRPRRLGGERNWRVL